ncbi:MAG: class I SAM-dependent methyltransferase [Alphaproteobacteria bacterium]|jgi:SAM-dependent methyltransferase|nr:class I SAM-dependent methyltransferase [Alphaproteobacteria bacterium]MDP6564419.1 class I SAM-dependent methyltransferase [Alphaproteobacteria bacterium]MDP6815630.1 class I SAM-dependent methyltransferase [Alphaproteobacteria bacterium]
MDDPIQRHPTRAEQLDILTDAIAAVTVTGDRVLDLGCGTGYVAWLLAGKRPGLDYTGVDLKDEALAAAEGNLAKQPLAFTGCRGDLSSPGGLDVGDGQFQVALSVLTFHDLADDDKRDLLTWTAERLAAGGYLFLYDRVRLTEPSLFPLQQAIWRRIEAVHGVAMRDAPDFAAYEADLSQANRPARLTDYGAWFEELGLAWQILHLHGNVTLLSACKNGGAA